MAKKSMSKRAFRKNDVKDPRLVTKGPEGEKMHLASKPTTAIFEGMNMASDMEPDEYIEQLYMDYQMGVGMGEVSSLWDFGTYLRKAIEKLDLVVGQIKYERDELGMLDQEEADRFHEFAKLLQSHIETHLKKEGTISFLPTLKSPVNGPNISPSGLILPGSIG